LEHYCPVRTVAFVSQQNLRVTEHQLAVNLPNACVICDPVNLTDFKPVPWARSDVVEVATVVRLNVDYKGQDVLLQTLAGNS
jgi:hypothetical protein